MQLEQKAGWPEDIDAVKAIITAFYLKIKTAYVVSWMMFTCAVAHSLLLWWVQAEGGPPAAQCCNARPH